MAILLKTKPEIDGLFGKPAIASNLMDLGGAPHGERAWEYAVGAYRIVVGYIAGAARYLAIRKSSGERLTRGDILSALSVELGASAWVIEPPFDDGAPAAKGAAKKGARAGARVRYYRAQRKDAEGANVVANYLGWTREAKVTMFLYAPYVEDAVPLMADEDRINGRLA